MSEFIYLFRMTEHVHQQAMGTPERMEKSMEKWTAWGQELGVKGHLVTVGEPLDRAGKVVKGKQAVTEGAYAESAEKNIVIGYMIIEARDINHAAALTAGCPIFEGGGSVEVRPTMTMNT